ncbi:MAG: CvpA family protein [Treponema sp.]|nr:CvpA family protein [Treponema sp.]
MNVLDFIFIGILLILTFRGLARGLINEVFGFGSFVVSLFLAIAFFRKAGELFAESMNPILSNVLGFLIVFICAFVLIKIVQMLVKTIFSGHILNSLDHALGLLLGFAEGAALVVLILFAMVELNPKINTEQLRSESQVTTFIDNLSL